VEWVATGAAGLSAAKRFKPHVIVLDVVMPGLDGWTVLTELKNDPDTQSIPVVMVTLLDQAEMGVSMGAVDYLIKPVNAPRLVSAVERWLGKPSAETNVLVVDDDPDMREIMQRTLQSAGYQVSVAVDGAKGLISIAQDPPDLVVLDLMMPEMDGFEFLHHLRREPRYSDIPVLVATAKELTEGELEMLKRSAQNVIRKEAHSRAELLHVVERQVTDLLRTRNSTRPPRALQGAV